MKKTVSVLVVFSSFLTATSFSQPDISLVNLDKMILNPAFTAIDTTFKREASLYNKAYFNDPLSGNSTIGTYQMRIDKIKSGVGLMINYNYWGESGFQEFKQVAAKLYYRYTVFPGLSVGLDAGFVNLNYKLNLDYVVFNGTSVTLIPYPEIAASNFDFDGDIGILYQIKNFYAGFSAEHLTNPQATFPMFDGYTGSISGNVSYPMVNYNGIAYNWNIGGKIPFGKCAIELSAAYYQQNILNLTATLEVPHFFLGFSALQSNPQDNDVFSKNDYYYYALIAGIKTYHNKIKLSFAYNFFPNAYQPYPSIQVLEGGASYSF